TDMDRVMNGTNSPVVNANTTNPANALYLDPNDLASWAFNPSRQRVDRIDEILTNQTSFNSTLLTGGVEHSLTGGLELMYERQKSLTSGTAAATIDGITYAAVDNPAAPFYAP